MISEKIAPGVWLTSQSTPGMIRPIVAEGKTRRESIQAFIDTITNQSAERYEIEQRATHLSLVRDNYETV